MSKPTPQKSKTTNWKDYNRALKARHPEPVLAPVQAIAIEHLDLEPAQQRRLRSPGQLPDQFGCPAPRIAHQRRRGPYLQPVRRW